MEEIPTFQNSEIKSDEDKFIQYSIEKLKRKDIEEYQKFYNSYKKKFLLALKNKDGKCVIHHLIKDHQFGRDYENGVKIHYFRDKTKKYTDDIRRLAIYNFLYELSTKQYKIETGSSFDFDRSSSDYDDYNNNFVAIIFLI